jgi:hypothetical protein
MTRRMLACAGLALVMTVVTWAAPPAHAAAAQAARADWSAGPVALGTGYVRHGRSLRVREVQRTLTRLEATRPAGEPRPVQPPRTPVAVAGAGAARAPLGLLALLALVAAGAVAAALRGRVRGGPVTVQGEEIVAASPVRELAALTAAGVPARFSRPEHPSFRWSQARRMEEWKGFGTEPKLGQSAGEHTAVPAPVGGRTAPRPSADRPHRVGLTVRAPTSTNGRGPLGGPERVEDRVQASGPASLCR